MAVDRQMDIFPADPTGFALARQVAGDAMADAIEFSELCDVDVDDFARRDALVAAYGLGRFERRKPVEAQPLQDAADCGDRNADLGGDLRADMALPAQSLDRRAGGGRCLAWRGMRPGRTVHQTRRPLGLKTVHPFGDGLGPRVELPRRAGPP